MGAQSARASGTSSCREGRGRTAPRAVLALVPILALACATLALAPSSVRAQSAHARSGDGGADDQSDGGAKEAAAACTEAARLVDEGDVDGALDEARWCVESLEQLRQRRTLSTFPDEVDGFVGGPLENRSAMGMTLMERAYSRDGSGGERVDVSLTSGAAGAGLAALAQMGMSLGGGSGRKLRVQKRTVVDMSTEGSKTEYLVELKSGGVLTIGSPTLSPDDVIGFVEAFPIQALDEALMP